MFIQYHGDFDRTTFMNISSRLHTTPSYDLLFFAIGQNRRKMCSRMGNKIINKTIDCLIANKLSFIFSRLRCSVWPFRLGHWNKILG